MIAVETALRFTAAWLAIGLGMFVASGSASALRAAADAAGVGVRTMPRMASALYVVPLVLGVGLMVAGAIGVVQVVPW
jgi:hypothetical protein